MKYCTNCGAEARGKFCSECGEKLNFENDISQSPNWENEIDFNRIISVSSVRNLISYNCFLSKENVDWKPLAKLGDTIFSPLTGLPSFSLAITMKPLSQLASDFSYWMTGAKIENSKEDFFRFSSGKILVSLLCFLACHGQKIYAVEQKEYECTLESVIPTGIRSYSSSLTIIVSKKGDGTYVKAAILTKGQFDDWGRSKQYLNNLFLYLSEMSANLSEIISNFVSTQDLEKTILNHDTYYKYNNYISGLKRMKNGRRFDLHQEIIDQGKAIEKGIEKLGGEES